MNISNFEIFEIHAEFCKALANPKRLIIIHALKNGSQTVGELASILNLPMANVSQHLKALRDQDIVTHVKEGQKTHYSLADKRLVQACDMIREIIVDLNKRKGKIIDFNRNMDF